MIFGGDALCSLGSCIESVQKLRNPIVEIRFMGIVGERLKYSNRQTILCAIEIEDILASVTALLLLPLKQFFNFGVLDNRDPIVVIHEPLNDVRNRIVVNATGGVAQ